MKRLVFFLMMVLMIGVSADAAVETAISGKNVILRTQTKPGENVMLIIAKKGEDINNNNSIYIMKESIADDMGIVEFDFDMNEEREGISTVGEFDIYLSMDNSDLIKETFIYASVEERDLIVDKVFQAKTEEALGDIINAEENMVVLKALNVDMDRYNALGEKRKEVISALYKYKSELSTGEEEKMIEYLSVDIVRHTMEDKNKDELTEVLEKSALSFEGVPFSKLSSEEKTWVTELIFENMPYTAADELMNRYAEANILYKINHLRLDKIENGIVKYSADLGIKDMPGYKIYLSLHEKGKVNDTIAENLKNTPVKSAKDLDELLSKVTGEIKETNSQSSNYGGGSAGGSKNSATANLGVTSAVPFVETKEIEKEIFNDLDDAKWAETAINKMAEAGIVAGDGSGAFNPNRWMTREEYVKIIITALNCVSENANCVFDDVKRDAWYYKYVASAYEKGIIYGINENQFGIGLPLTRQDMTVIALRAAETIKEIEHIRDFENFNDEDSISDYAKAAVKELYCAGVINGLGDNSFKPKNYATRAEGAMLIYNLFVKP